jgi:ribonuclease HI
MGVGLRATRRTCGGDPDLQDTLADVWSRPMGRLLNQEGASRLSHLLTPRGRHVERTVGTRARVTGGRIVAGLVARVCKTATSILQTPIRASLGLARIVIHMATALSGAAGQRAQAGTGTSPASGIETESAAETEPETERGSEREAQTRGRVVEIFGDGSLHSLAEGGARGAFACTWQEDGEWREVWGRTRVAVHSTHCELQALLAALVSCPRAGTGRLVYWTDSQALATGWETGELPVRQELKRACWPDWRQARALALRLPCPVEVRWTRGHAGTEGNERADRLANLAHTRPPTIDLDRGPWRDARDSAHPFEPTVRVGGVAVAIPIYCRTFLKLAHRARRQALVEASVDRQPWSTGPGTVDTGSLNRWLGRWRARRHVMSGEDRLVELAIRWRHNRLPVAHNMNTWTGGRHGLACGSCGEPETQLHLLVCPCRTRDLQGHIDAHVEAWWARQGRRRGLDGATRTRPILPLGPLQLSSPEGVETVASLIARYPTRALRTHLETAGLDGETTNAFLYFLMDSMVDLFRRRVWHPRCMGLGPRTRFTWAPRARQPTGRPRGRPRKLTSMTTPARLSASSSVTELWRAVECAANLILRGVASPGLWSVTT